MINTAKSATNGGAPSAKTALTNIANLYRPGFAQIEATDTEA